jgi:hypothetical protein
MTHSGDLTSAPEGAAEFIDVRLSAAKSRTSYDKVPWRYLAPAVYRYSGPSFGELDEAFAGWMLRDEPSSDRKTFDPATVVNAFALTGSRGTALPFVYDLHTGEVIYLDVYVSSFFAARVEESASSVSRIASALASRTAIRPHICDVVQAHVSARGAVLVDDALRRSSPTCSPTDWTLLTAGASGVVLAFLVARRRGCSSAQLLVAALGVSSQRERFCEFHRVSSLSARVTSVPTVRTRRYRLPRCSDQGGVSSVRPSQFWSAWASR